MNDSDTVQNLFRSVNSMIASQQSVDRSGHVVIPLDDDNNKPATALRDFWWDKVILTMILLILGVTGAQTIGSFFQNTDAKCLIEENHTTNEEEYINQLCTGASPSRLYGRPIIYFAIALLSGLQLFWSLICSGRIESFKSTVNSMSLKRNPKTGQFEASDLESSRYLERQLCSRVLTCTYFIFKGVQLVFSIASIIVPFFLFEVGMDTAFVCSRTAFSLRQWPLSASEVYCTYVELANLQLLLWLNMGALLVIVLAIICGIFMLTYRFHSFDHKQIASFLLRTGLKRKHYTPFRDRISWRKLCCMQGNDTVPHRIRASWDMMFLIIRQYQTNKKLGEALLNCLISVHLDFLAECTCAQMLKVTDHESENGRNNTTDGNQQTENETDTNKGSHHHLERTIKALVQCVKHKTRDGSTVQPYCILVTNWNDSLAYLNSIHFKGMVCINFNSNITDKDAGVFQRNHRTNMIPIYHTPSHLWSWTCQDGCTPEEIDSGIKEIMNNLFMEEEHPLMILLAPLSDEVYNVQHLELRVRNLLGCLHNNAIVRQHVTYVSVISPTAVIARDLTGDYVQSRDESIWWLKPRVNRPARPNLMIRGSSSITEEVKYDYSYSLYCIHVPES